MSADAVANLTCVDLRGANLEGAVLITCQPERHQPGSANLAKQPDPR